MDLYIEKDSDLMRATLVAIGLGELFERLAGTVGGLEVWIRDLGGAYVVSVPFDIGEALAYLRDCNGGWLPPLVPAIIKAYSARDQKLIDADPESPIRYKYFPRAFEQVYGSHAIVNYEEQQDLVRARRTRENGNREEDQTPVPHSNFPLWAHLCSYFGKGSAMRKVYPNILHAWYSHHGDDAEKLLALIVRTFTKFPNAMADARVSWMEWGTKIEYADYIIETDVSAASIVSPSTVQGASTKNGALRINNEPLKSFWLELYLAFAGYFIVGLPFNLGDDVMLFYPLPKNITIKSLRQQMHAYRNSEIGRSLYGHSNQMNRAKLEILTNLSFYGNHVRHIHNSMMHGENMVQALGGLVSYYYKNNGGTQIPFDETLFKLPPFLPIPNDAKHISDMDALLVSHFKMIDTIKGKVPNYTLTIDELTILSKYRQFMTQACGEDWWHFVIAYNRYRFINMCDFYVPDLHVDTLEETLMNIQPDRKDFQQILEDEGLQHIANAIRECTVNLRYLKDVKKHNLAFRVRYGLGEDLLRNAHDPNLFIGELGRFLHDYARESSQVQVETGDTRVFVSPKDIQQITKLIAIYGSSTVAHLLVATGYSTVY